MAKFERGKITFLKQLSLVTSEIPENPVVPVTYCCIRN